MYNVLVHSILGLESSRWLDREHGKLDKREIWHGIGIKTTQFETLIVDEDVIRKEKLLSFHATGEKCCFVETCKKSSKVR